MDWGASYRLRVAGNCAVAVAAAVVSVVASPLYNLVNVQPRPAP